MQLKRLNIALCQGLGDGCPNCDVVLVRYRFAFDPHKLPVDLSQQNEVQDFLNQSTGFKDAVAGLLKFSREHARTVHKGHPLGFTDSEGVSLEATYSGLLNHICSGKYKSCNSQARMSSESQ